MASWSYGHMALNEVGSILAIWQETRLDWWTASGTLSWNKLLMNWGVSCFVILSQDNNSAN